MLLETDDEFAALGRAFADAEADHPVAVAVVRFLIYTGARKFEAQRLKWEHVHGDRAVLPDSNTGPRTIWPASFARAVLAARQRPTNCPWVFASPCGGRAMLDKEWNTVRAAAESATLRIHDLRHSHSAVAINGSEGLRVVAGQLGHADIKTTPYNGFAGMAADEERGLSEAYRSTKLARRLEGQGLNDLYVRFFRMAERRIAENTGQGVVCFIDDSVLTLPDSELLETALSGPLYGTGDDGKLTGVFVGRHHQGAASTLVRDDLEAAIGATR